MHFPTSYFIVCVYVCVCVCVYPDNFILKVNISLGTN